MKILTRSAALAVMTLFAPSFVLGEAPQPFPEFAAKRIKVPGAATAVPANQQRPRITVQIDPVEQAALLAARPPMQKATAEADDDDAAPKAAGGSYDWFWNEVSPALTGAGPGRLGQAMRALQNSDKVSAPRLQTLQEIARAQGAPILR